MVIYAQQNDTIDAICWRHYGRTLELTERVLNANPGLAEHGPFLPHGTPVELSEIMLQATAQTVQLWE